jgi:hypothetical protein
MYRVEREGQRNVKDARCHGHSDTAAASRQRLGERAGSFGLVELKRH